MTYYANTKEELETVGIRDGELALYTGTANRRGIAELGPDTGSKNVYCYLWRSGEPHELGAIFRRDKDSFEVLEVSEGGEDYAFLRDKPSGYIRQIFGPSRPIIVGNIGAIPLRVDTFLGKFTIQAGTMLRLDENAPKRKTKKVLLTFGTHSGSRSNQPLKSAELWDGVSWRRLNIRKETYAPYADYGLTVLDGYTIVQYMTVNADRDVLMMDAPELDPDYQIFVTVRADDWIGLRFQKNDYVNGRIMQRRRTIFCEQNLEPVIYDLRKPGDTLAHNTIDQCAAELPGRPSSSEVEESRPAPKRWRRPQDSEKLRAFLDDDEASDKQEAPNVPPPEFGERPDEAADLESTGLDCLLEELDRGPQKPQTAPVPEPPENFPE